MKYFSYHTRWAAIKGPLFLIILLGSTILQAQLIKRSGIVTDAIGPLGGVTVQIKNTNKAVTTNTAGAFVIETANSDILVFSLNGYATIEQTVGANTTFNTLLVVQANDLEEIEINAGYYTVKDRDRTGSIARVTAKVFEDQSVTNPIEALQGRVAGVQIIKNSGMPGSGIDIKIRGQNSLMAGNQPLYIIDGVPFNAGSLSNATVSQTIIPLGNISPLNAINPSSILSIEILKDADATALYGSRGANGVILITTKKGNRDQTKWEVGSTTGIANVTSWRKLLNTHEYLSMRKQAFANDGITTYPANAHDLNGNWDQNKYTNWQKKLFGKTADFQNLEIATSGGNATTSFRLSSQNYNETTVFPGDFNYNKWANNANLNHQSKNQKLQLNFNAMYVIEKNNLPANDFTNIAMRLAPNAPNLYDEQGNLNWENNTWTNPLAQLQSHYQNNTTTFMANLGLNYQLFHNAWFKVNMGYNNNTFIDFRTIPHTIHNPSFGRDSSTSQAYANNTTRSNVIVEPQIDYKWSWNNHHFTTLVGSSFQNNEHQTLTMLATGFSNNKFIKVLSAANNLRVINENQSQYKYQSLFARINYNYNHWLFLNATGRRDGSSRFGPNNRWGNFGAIGAAINFTNFVDVNIVSLAKIRGSVGVVGNDQIGDYQYLQTYTINDFTYDNNIGLQPSSLQNDNFKWEKNNKKEIALELGFWNGNTNLSLAHFQNKTTNLLVSYPLSAVTGFTTIQSNLDAVVSNKGWEINLNAKILNNHNFKWSTALNAAIVKNELLDYPNLQNSSYANRYVVGQPLTILKLYKFKGVNPESGLFEFEDFNNDGNITATEDRQFLANTDPKWQGGWTNNFNYKNWELDFLFQFVKKDGLNQFYNNVAAGTMNNQSTQVLDSWTQPNDSAQYQLYTIGTNAAANLSNSQFAISNGVISDASFIRLKSVNLAYSLPIKNKNIDQVKVFLQAHNVFTMTNFKGGYPEQSIGFLPALRRINLGCKISF